MVYAASTNPDERLGEDLLLQGKSAEAAALAKTGKDNLLVILVEFGGTDTVTWNPGDIWDPIGNPDAGDYEAYGDCSGIITEATEFTYAGPLHNELPNPPSITHRAYNAIWTEDFSPSYYQELLFGNGVYVEYTTEDGTPVTIDLLGYSMRQYFEEQSRGMYTVDGDIVGWVQVPHSEAYYGADACPGGRSAGYSGIADGFAAAIALGATGLLTLTVQFLMAPTHSIGGVNYADVWHATLSMLGCAQLLAAGMLLLRRRYAPASGVTQGKIAARA